jgi:hypothetical protein
MGNGHNNMTKSTAVVVDTKVEFQTVTLQITIDSEHDLRILHELGNCSVNHMHTYLNSATPELRSLTNGSELQLLLEKLLFWPLNDSVKRLD